MQVQSPRAIRLASSLRLLRRACVESNVIQRRYDSQAAIDFRQRLTWNTEQISFHGSIYLAGVSTAAATWIAFAEKTVTLADSSANTQVASVKHVEPDSWKSLIDEIHADNAFTRMRAVETLVSVSCDADNHDALVRAGAIPALLAAYNSTRVEDPFNVNVLRALADLAKKSSSHDRFLECDVAPFLASVLNQCDIAEPSKFNSWLSWIGNWFGYRSNPNSASAISNNRSGTSSSSLTTNDVPGNELSAVEPLLSMSSGNSTIALTPADLRDGVIYHATRCVANLARNSSTHGTLIAGGLLNPMIALLKKAPLDRLTSADSFADIVGDEQNVDTLRFATLSVAALSKSESASVLEKRGHEPLIALMEQTKDSILQTYAAGGIRNLCRHSEREPEKLWHAHRELVVAGLASALRSALSTDSNPQVQVFAAIAFGDVLSTGHPKAHVISKRMIPAVEPFTRLLVSGNKNVARACQRASELIFSRAADANGMVLTAENEKKLSELSRSLAQQMGPFIPSVASSMEPIAISALKAFCLDQTVSDALVEKGAVSVLIDAISLKDERGNNAVAAIARLSARSRNLSDIEQRGGLKAVLKRSASAGDGRWEATALANFARVDRNRPDIAHGGLPMLLRAASSQDVDARTESARALFNLCIVGVSRVLCAQGGSLVPLMKIAELSTGFGRRCAVGAIAAISELHTFGANIVELDGIKILLSAVKSEPALERDVARCFAQLSNHVGAHEALVKEGAAAWLVRTISRGDAAPDTLHHAVAALSNIAYTSEVSHKPLRNAGALTALTGLSAGIYPPQVVHYARTALSNLRGDAAPILQHAEGQGAEDPL